MENSYGIGIANRYELFWGDEDGGSGGNKGASKKAKQQKKSTALTSVAANVNAVKDVKTASINTTNGVAAANNKITKVIVANGNPQSNRINSEKTPREGKENNKAQLPRNPNKPNNTNRVNDDRPVRRQVGPANGERSSLPNRRFGGGKREFDRQSGSDKTGIKAVDKRDGGGAHNWGSIKQQIDDSNKPDWESEQGKEKAQPIEGSDNNGNVQPANKEQNAEQVANNQTEDEEAKEITLDEWKAQRANRSKPQFNIRKAGEGEDTSQWKKMVALQSRKNKDDDSDEELEYDPSKYPQRVGRQKHVLDLEFHFNDGPRSALSRRRGREQRGPRNPEEGGSSAAPRALNNEQRRRPQQNNNNNRNKNTDRLLKRDDRNRQNAPKVYDEHDFPSLG